MKSMRDINSVNKMLENMSDFELSRWQALMDAVNIIAEKAENKKVSFNSIDIKPSAIEKYIESTCDIYCRKIATTKEQQLKMKGNQASNILPVLINAISNCEGEAIHK